MKIWLVLKNVYILRELLSLCKVMHNKTNYCEPRLISFDSYNLLQFYTWITLSLMKML